MLCLKAHAKINWSLDILGTREDGYHLMDMLMQSVEMHDTLWLEEADELRYQDAPTNKAARFRLKWSPTTKRIWSTAQPKNCRSAIT